MNPIYKCVCNLYKGYKGIHFNTLQQAYTVCDDVREDEAVLICVSMLCKLSDGQSCCKE